MKVVAVNGSPRRNWNTSKLCQEALRGAQSIETETELIHLETIKFKGCMSCFACHTKKYYDSTLCSVFSGIANLISLAIPANLTTMNLMPLICSTQYIRKNDLRSNSQLIWKTALNLANGWWKKR